MTAHPPAMDALECGISKVLRDSLSGGNPVIVETASGIAGTVVDYLTWPNVQPLLRRFVTELDPDQDPQRAIGEARTELANVLGPLAPDLTLADLIASACQRSFEHGAAHAITQISDALGPEPAPTGDDDPVSADDLARHLQAIRDHRDPEYDHPWTTWAQGFDTGDFESLATDVLSYLSTPADALGGDPHHSAPTGGA